MVYSGEGADDYCYLAHTTSIVFGHWPDFSKEAICLREVPKASVGPGLLASPFSFLFSIADRWNDHPIIHERNVREIERSFTVFGFVFTSVLMLAISILYLYRSSLTISSSRSSYLAITAMILTQGVLLFSFRRPVFSHMSEFFVQSLMVGFACAQLQKKKDGSLISFWNWMWIFFLSAIAILIRYNNLFVALGWIFFFFVLERAWQRPFWKQHSVSLVAGLGLFVTLLSVFKFYPNSLAGGEKYSGEVAVLFHNLDPSYLILRLYRVLAGFDWGLAFTAPFLLFSMMYFFYRKGRTPLGIIWWIPIISCIPNFIILLLFGSQGGWYGYRYFIFCSIPVFTPVLALCFDNARKMTKFPWLPVFIIGIAIAPTLSMLLFEGNPTNLTLQPIQQDGRVDWGNLNFQKEVWQSLFTQPKATIIAILKGGPLYVVYLLFVALGKSSTLPAELLQKYPVFDLSVFFEWLTLLAAPILIMSVFLKERKP